MKKISKNTHGLIDYVAASALIVSGFVNPYGEPSASFCFVVTGALIILINLFTQHRFGVVPFFSMASHLLFDTMLGILTGISPWLFGFSNITWIWHLCAGCWLILFSWATCCAFEAPVRSGRRRKFHKRIFRTFSLR